jgi:hypothetical protein
VRNAANATILHAHRQGEFDATFLDQPKDQWEEAAGATGPVLNLRHRILRCSWMASCNLVLRRAYLVRPRPELSSRLEVLGLSDDIYFLAQQSVVMTTPLPYEDKIEGYRELILRKCKEAFLQDLMEYEPLADAGYCEALLGSGIALDEAFDRWWTAEEIETLEIATTW